MTTWKIPEDAIATFREGPNTLHVVDIDFAEGKFVFIVEGPQGDHRKQERFGFTEFHRMYRRNPEMYRITER